MANRRKKSSDSNDDSEQNIRMRAYELFLERGGRDGDQVSDWLQAESEVRERTHTRPRPDDEARDSRP